MSKVTTKQQWRDALDRLCPNWQRVDKDHITLFFWGHKPYEYRAACEELRKLGGYQLTEDAPQSGEMYTTAKWREPHAVRARRRRVVRESLNKQPLNIRGEITNE